MKFFEQFSVSNETFSKTYDSFAVESMVRNSMVMQEKFGLEGVPAVVVNGKYRTSGSMAGTYGRLTEVVATLAEREHEELVAQR
jgi:thiol:disulfide interchange protein DsbA